MANSKADRCFDNLTELIDFSKTKFSESDTRAKLIDPLFKDCLDWTEQDITRETHIRAGFLDYVFSIDGIKKFVLEAKRTGVSFTIPASLSNRYYRISGTITTDKNITKAIKQAQRYCIDTGVRFGVISNGNQYILFEAFRYGQSWMDSKCVVFRSLEDILDNCTMFWNLLSRDCVRSGSLKEYISREPAIVKYEKPLDKIHNPTARLIRNPLTQFLQPIVDLIFLDIIEESQLEILKKCYVLERQFESASLLIKSIFDRLPHYADRYNIKQVLETDTGAGVFQASFEKCEEFLRHEVPKGSLILLLGGIGTGKTTFLHHFFNYVIERPKVLWFYTDFKESFPDPERIEEYIYKGILIDYRRRYQSYLQKELEDVGFSRQLKPDREDILMLFSILNLKGYTVSLVLDNVDRHYLTVPEFQERVLLVARSLTNDLKTLNILTLREESFFRSIRSGVLDAYNIPKHHISSPNLEKLVKLRIDYTLDLLEKPDKEIMEILQSPAIATVNKELVKPFFRIIKYSLRTSRTVGREILRFLNDVSGGDMREALRFFNRFCVSGNTNVNEMLYIYKDQGRYDVPYHHVIKSIILGDFKYYSSTHSDIMNVFDLDPSFTDSYFLHLNILNYLYDRTNYSSTLGKGYVEINTILFEAEKVLISQKAIEGSLRKSAYFGLVEFDNQSREGYDTATHVKIRSTGRYYLESLIHRFVYLDLVWEDTPISDTLLVSQLRRLIDKEDLEDRFYRTDLFLNYLKEREDKEFADNPEYKDSSLTKHAFMDEIIGKYEEEKEYIRLRREERSVTRHDVDLTF